MILSETVDILIIPKILKHYLSKGYDAKVKNVLTINVSDLTNKSRIKIKVKCDVCGTEKYLSYQKYTKNISSYNYYACSQKCSSEKCKETFLINYNTNHPLKNETIKQKSKDTCKLRYNKDYYFQTEEFKQKSEETSYFKYDVSHPMKSDIIKDVLKQSMMDKYNVENSMYLNEVKRKVKNSKILNNIISSDELTPKLNLYKRIVKNITLKYKKELFNNWDGIDYYDKECIKENLILNPLDRMYPTIDHKTSILYGFLNDIPAEVIGDISNLCITKKHINSSKKEKCSI